MLEENKIYTYKYRHRFIDGHTSRTCQPVIVKTTTTQRSVELNLEIVEDLNSEAGNLQYAEIELYRKDGESGFHLIASIDPDDGKYTIQGAATKYVSFEDAGEIGGGELSELQTSTTKAHRTQTEVQDRIVKANVEYKDRSLSGFPLDFTIASTPATHQQGGVAVPSGANVQLFGKVVFDDNQEGFHFPVSNPLNDVGSDEDIIFPDYNVGDVGDLNDSGYKDLSLFLKVDKPKNKSLDESAIPFNTIELNNINVPTLETWNDDPSFNNSRPHIFLGWKYIIRTVLDNGDGTYRVIHWIRDNDLDENPVDVGSEKEPNFADANFAIDDYQISGSVFDDKYPPHLELEGVNGQTLQYHRHAFSEDAKWEGENVFPAYFDTAIYKLSFADALKIAIQAGNIKVRMVDSLVSQVSANNDLSEYIDFEVGVDALLDTSFGTNDFYNNRFDLFTVPNSCRIYLVLENDTIYDEIDNYSVVNPDIIGPYDEEGYVVKDGELDPTLSFELVGVEFEEGGDHTSQSIENYLLYEGLEGSLNLINSPVLETVVDQLIYVGSFNDDSSFNARILDNNKLKFTGFEFIKEQNLNYVGLVDNVSLESVLLRSDIDLLENGYPNQVIWSQPTAEQGGANNSRTFLYTSFLNIGTEHGQILNVESFGNDLLVFCERGVALIRVGAKLANQSSGDVYLDSSRFLSSPQWILEDVPSVKANSIVRSDRSIFFADGRDVWEFNGKLTPISSGHVDVDGYCVGGYDPYNKEYRVSVFPSVIVDADDNDSLQTGGYTTSPKTYAYSKELREWSGPHTYGDIYSTYRNNTLISFLDFDLVEHNRSNDFNGREYETVIESTANDLNDVTAVKRYRKFYLDTVPEIIGDGDLVFEYASEYFTDEKSVDLYGIDKINGLYRIGFESGEGRPNNSRVMFWKIRTSLEDFVLNGLSFSYLPTLR